MTLSALIYTLIFVLLSLGAILYAFFGRKADQFTRLKDVYRDKYLDDTATLDDELARGKISQEDYERAKAELAHDLLDVAVDDRNFGVVTKSLFALLGVAIVAFSAVYFWQTGYDAGAQDLDAKRFAAKPHLEEWLKEIDLADLKRGKSIPELNPPEAIKNNYIGAFSALNQMSSKDHHSDKKELYLLGNMYLDVNQIDIAQTIYFDLVKLDPSDYNAYYTLLNIQLAMNEYQLDERLEYLYDDFVMRNPNNENLILYYATILFENKKMDKALHYFSYLAELYPEGSEKRELMEQMITGLELQYAGKPGPKLSPESDSAGKTLSGKSSSRDDKEERPAISRDIPKGIEVTVKLDTDNIVIPESGVLYLFLRNAPVGPPLAAKRISLSELDSLPATFWIEERDRLMPGDQPILNEPNLSVSAKISLSGDPVSHPGDIEAESIELHADERAATVTLNRVVE